MKNKNTNSSVLLNSIFLFFAFTGTLFAQAPTFEWAKSTGGTGAEMTNSVALDDSGNVYTTGTFEGTADFDPGTGVFNFIGLNRCICC